MVHCIYNVVQVEQIPLTYKIKKFMKDGYRRHLKPQKFTISLDL